MSDYKLIKTDNDFEIVQIPFEEEIYFGDVLQERYAQPLNAKHKEQLKKIFDMISFLKTYNFSCVVDTNGEMTQIHEALTLLENICRDKYDRQN